jgi:hypothetical protein
VVTSSISKPVESVSRTQSLGGAYRGRVRERAFIEVSIYSYV